MKKLQKDYLERVYAGVLGKTIGVRHGSNDEGWSYEKIKETFGEIKDYLFTFKNFASDDDTNGTFLLPRALADYECSENITSEQIADTLLNYAPDHHGFFWWGPVTAYRRNARRIRTSRPERIRRCPDRRNSTVRPLPSRSAARSSLMVGDWSRLRRNSLRLVWQKGLPA